MYVLVSGVGTGSLDNQILMGVLLACRYHRTSRNESCSLAPAPVHAHSPLRPEGEAGGMWGPTGRGHIIETNL